MVRGYSNRGTVSCTHASLTDGVSRMSPRVRTPNVRSTWALNALDNDAYAGAAMSLKIAEYSPSAPCSLGTAPMPYGGSAGSGIHGGKPRR